MLENSSKLGGNRAERRRTALINRLAMLKTEMSRHLRECAKKECLFLVEEEGAPSLKKSKQPTTIFNRESTLISCEAGQKMNNEAKLIKREIDSLQN